MFQHKIGKVRMCFEQCNYNKKSNYDVHWKKNMEIHDLVKPFLKMTLKEDGADSRVHYILRVQHNKFFFNFIVFN